MKGPKKAERAPLLERTRKLKMAKSVHAYVRGNIANFYDWLERSPSARHLPLGPPVWICGDCHLGNLGPIASIDSLVEVQIRDLDHTVIGNPAHDLVRLGLSLATAARNSLLPGVTMARMVEEMVEGYRLALDGEGGAPEPDVVRAVRRRALGRRWKELAEERIEDAKQPTIPLGKKFWPVNCEERTALAALFAQQRVCDMILALNGRDSEHVISLVDAAYWRKGCSSLGKLRFAALVAIRAPRKKAAKLALIDLKEAVAAVAPVAPSVEMPTDYGTRVVTGARALSPNLGERMLSTRVLGKPIVLRELMPQDLKIEIDQFTKPEATRVARYLAYVVRKAHARQMDASTRADWGQTLDRSASNIEAPSWLWNGIVDLSASHEGGYLEHCRLFARAYP